MPALVALGLTLLVEVPLYCLGLVALGLAGRRRAVLAGVAVNLITHPVLWRVLGPGWSVPRLCVAEAAVCLVEAGLLWLAVRRRSAPLLLVLAVASNAASVGAGLLVSAVVSVVSGG